MIARLCEREKQWNCPANYLPEKSNRSAYHARKKIDACENAAKAGLKPRRPQSPTPQVAANPFTHKILHGRRRAIASFGRLEKLGFLWIHVRSWIARRRPKM